ncbi:MAG: metallophosphoesterase, partial [Pseudomonadota bacterium]
MIRFEIDYLRALGTAGRAASFGILLLLVYVPTLAVAADLQDEWSGVERVVTVGDVHGDYDGYINVLKDAGIVNRRGKWVAGETHLVQIGDVSDRGPDTAKIIRHLKKLEKQARKAGGYVHALIGNHEAMNMLGDLRYVHPGEYEALKSRKAKALRDAYYRQVVAYLEAQENGPIIDEAFETRWMEEHPLGYV